MPEPTSTTATPVVAVHLGAHGPTARAVRDWCGTHRRELRRRGLTAHTSWSGLREAVPALDWRSDRSRRQLRDYLTATGPTLFSSHAPLGPVYRHTGGDLFPTAAAGVDGLGAALDDVPWTAHLSIGRHADALVEAWVAAVRAGHEVRFDDLYDATRDASWVPLAEHLVRTAGARAVTVHDAGATRPDRGAGPAVVSAVLTDLLGEPSSLGDDAAASPARHWSTRQVDVALAALPHLRSWDERRALRDFVDRSVDGDDAPCWPLTAVQEDELADRDAADRQRLAALGVTR
ncbi:hypothetical protein GCM10023216_07210 [Isoptericola chiayiensis]|uniref:Uncharacterized protein n=1 Tax=Isoptericola chiayiensis TaxID=579446 RepID=A0ABP8Y2R7_9MICO|nr:hypothetical protein [Isoptericola chiayiensis]NOV99319.1 hypothetical protein [Isoptericola chiayiensis]